MAAKNITSNTTGSHTNTSAPVLQIISGDGEGKRLKVMAPCIIGRASDCELILSDRKISRHHLIIRPVENGLVVRDLGSKNGVFLNGRPIKDDETLKHGDVLLLGETFLSIQLPGKGNKTGHMKLVSVSTAAETHFDEVATPHKITRESLSEQALKILMEVLSLIQGDHDPNACLRRVTQRLLGLFNADSAVVCFSSQTDYEPAIILSNEKKSHFLADILQMTFMKRKGILIANAFKQTSIPSSGKLPKKLLASQMCVPFIDKDIMVGMLAIGAKRPFSFNKSHLNLLTVLAKHLAPVIAKGREQGINGIIHRVEKEESSHPLIGHSAPMQQIHHLIDLVAWQPIGILITGDTGSGKEIVARAIHQKSPRPEGPFICINCAAIPADIFESELFGHEKGSFTGAYKAKPGKFELAINGMLFFDEIGELPLHLQAKLLRVLETQEFSRIGGIVSIKTNARFLFATNRDLAEMVREGNFREDLYFRINTFEIPVPPLRNHPEDIPFLADFFLEKIQMQLKRPRPFRYSSALIGCFLAYNWPGNIRELRNVLEQMAVLSDTEYLDESLLPDRIRVGPPSPNPRFVKSSEGSGGLMSSVTDRTQKQLVLQALKEANGQKKKAAEILGISRPTLDKKLRLFGIDNIKK
jgi:two-component system, NtrC family, response regulator HydG